VNSGFCRRFARRLNRATKNKEKSFNSLVEPRDKRKVQLEDWGFDVK